MNQEALKLLADALASGHYRAISHGAMRMTTVENGRHFVGWSVLGVMADVFMTHAMDLTWKDNSPSPRWIESGLLDVADIFTYWDEKEKEESRWRLDVPPIVLEWYGISREQSSQFWMLQSRGYSLAQIGKAIEKAIEKKRAA